MALSEREEFSYHGLDRLSCFTPDERHQIARILERARELWPNAWRPPLAHHFGIATATLERAAAEPTSKPPSKGKAPGWCTYSEITIIRNGARLWWDQERAAEKAIAAEREAEAARARADLHRSNGCPGCAVCHQLRADLLR